MPRTGRCTTAMSLVGATTRGKPPWPGRTSAGWKRSGAFPPKGADFEIGVIHATPVVVNGYVYFGTVNKAAFYKLTPDGKVKWSFPLNEKDDRVNKAEAGDRQRHLWLRPGDRGRRLFRHARRVRLRAGSGHRQGKVAAGHAGQDVPGCSPAERDVRLADPGRRQAHRRRRRPRTGDQVLSARVRRLHGSRFRHGPGAAIGPHRLEVRRRAEARTPRPADHDQGCLGRARLPLRSRDQHGLVHAVVSCGFADHFLRHRHQQRAAATHQGRSPARHPLCLRRDRPRRPRRLREMGDADQPRGRLELHACGLRPEGPAATWTCRSATRPKIYTIPWNGTPTLVVGFGCKNGGFYVVRACGRHDPGPHAALHRTADGPAQPAARQAHAGPAQRASAACRPAVPPMAGACTPTASTPFGLGTQESPARSRPPTGGRVVAISLDTKEEHWRHERPKVASVGGPPPKPVFKNVGDPVASGIAVANGVVYFTTLRSSKLVALDAATGEPLQRDPPAARVVRTRRVPRPRLCRHGQHRLTRRCFHRSHADHGHALLLRPAG